MISCESRSECIHSKSAGQEEGTIFLWDYFLTIALHGWGGNMVQEGMQLASMMLMLCIYGNDVQLAAVWVLVAIALTSVP